MSFTAIVKNEVSKLEVNNTEKISELAAIMHYSNDLKVTTENASVARRIFKVIKDIYGVNAIITVRKGYNYHKNYIYILDIKQKQDLIIDDLNLNNKIPHSYMVDDDSLLRAYLRGLFLICGSINDPKTSRYHLELLVSEAKEAVFVQKLLNIFDLNAKILSRSNGYMIYIKEADKISDFLKIIRAHNAVLYFEDVRVYHQEKNIANRLNNCEQANIDKIIQTANIQLKYIEIIEKNLSIELLDDKTKEVLEYRKKYPEASLKELSEIISLETNKSITKSGLNHRFRKMKELAERLEKN